MSYYEQKAKHAYECYKTGKPRKKVYAVVEKGDKFVVLKINGDIYKYSLAGGGIEDKEDVVTAIKREVLEELNIQAEYVRSLGKFTTQSKWNYKGKDFWVDDDIEIVYTRFLSYGSDNNFGVEGEFGSADQIAEITKDEMLSTVAEFTKYGIKL